MIPGRAHYSTGSTMTTHPSNPNNTTQDPERAKSESEPNVLAPDQIQYLIRDLPVDGEKNPNERGNSRVIKQQKAPDIPLKAMHSAASPLKKIPPEILGKIFYHYVGRAIVLPPSASSNPWKLAHVSCHWRNVLWATSEIWRTVEVRLLWKYRTQDYGSAERLANARHFFNEIIYRSQSQFSLLVENYTVAPVLDLIYPLSHRFRCLDIFIVSYQTFISFLELPPGSLPCLEYIRMDIFYEPSQSSPTLNVGSPSLQTAGQLKRVDFTFNPVNEPVVELLDTLDPTIYMRLLPWSQLTHLALTSLDIPWTVAHTFLSQCSSLVSCHITVHNVSDAVITPSLILLLHLDTLQLKQAGDIEWDKFFQPFKLPSLRVLGVNHAPTLNQFISPARSILCPNSITALVLRSGCKLEILSIGRINGERINSPVTFPDIDILLKACPTLQCLKGTILVPASVFTSMQFGNLHLPGLADMTCHVQPDGLQAFLGLMNSHVVFSDHTQAYLKFTGSIRRAFILCHTGRGYKLAYRLYRRSSWIYQIAGIQMGLVGVRVGGEEEDDGDDHHDNEDDHLDTIANISSYYKNNGDVEEGRDDASESNRARALLFEVGNHFGWLS